MKLQLVTLLVLTKMWTWSRVLGVRHDMLVTCITWSRNSTVSLIEVQIMTCAVNINMETKAATQQWH